MKKDIALALAGAILGAAISYAVEKFNPHSTYGYVLLLMLSLAFLLSFALLGPLRLVLSGDGGIKLAGVWTSEWTYQKRGDLVTVEDELKIQQMGRFVRGYARSTSLQGPHPFVVLSYRLEGEITRDAMIEGRWRNADEGRLYRGTFQGRIHRGGDTVTLLWLGTSDDDIRSGSWTWSKRSS